MLDPRMEGSYSRSICENESCESSDSRHADPCPHSLFTKNDCHLRGLSCRELSIHRSGSQSYIDNFPLVSRACQSFLASSLPRQDFTHSLCARRPFEAQSIHRSAGFLRALRHPCGERDVSREADICTRRETSAPDRSALRRACKQRNSFERVFVVRAIVG